MSIIESVEDSARSSLLVNHAKKQKHSKAGQYIKSIVYGGLDGLITTLCVAISGISSDSLPPSVLAFGFASLIGDAIAMGMADYLGTKSEAEFIKTQQKRERQEIQNDFQSEKKQMIDIYIGHGLERQVSNEIVQIISQDKEEFLKIMMIEELKLISQDASPVRNFFITFISFSVFGFMPLIPIIVADVGSSDLNHNTLIAVISIAILFLFVLGFGKSIVTSAKWYLSCLQTLLIGAVSAGTSYGVGLIFGG